jgi:hypothetical protein
MADLDFGHGERSIGSLFSGLASGMKQGAAMNAARNKLAFEKQKFQLQQQQLAETKKKNTMNAAIKRIETLMPGGKLFQLKENAPDLYKNLMGQYLTQGFPEIDPNSDTYKTMRQGLLGDGPQVKNIVSFLSNYSNKLTAGQRITLVNMVKRDPGSLVQAMEQAGEWAEAFDEKQTLTRMAKALEPTTGAAHTPRSLGAAGRKSVRIGLEGGLLPKDLSISAMANLGGQMADRERSEIQADLDLNKTVMVQSTPDAAPRSILARDVGGWLDRNPEGRVFSQQALAGGGAQQLLTKRQAGTARGVRVNMAGLLGSAVQLRKDFARLGPGIAGFRGGFGEALGGIMGQISPQLGSLVTKGITGASPEALSKFRADAQAMIAKLIPIFTGEESGRISEPERDIAKKASKALSPGASQAEILGALNSITNGAFLAADRSVVSATGKPTWGFILKSGQVSEALWTKHFDKIQSISKLSTARVVDLLNALESQQRSFIATKLWAGAEGQ